MKVFSGDRDKNRKLFTAILILIILGLCGLSAYYYNLRQKTFTVTGSLKDIEPRGVGLMGGRTKQWTEGGKYPYESGMEFDFELVNPGKYTIYDWRTEIVFDDEYEIDSYWNGEFSQEDKALIVTPSEETQSIRGGESKTFGLVMITYDAQDCADYLVSYRLDTKVTSSPLFWILLGGVIFASGLFLNDELNYAKYRKIQQREQETQMILLESFRTFARIIDAKDPYTQGHSMRVAAYSRLIAKELGYSESDQDRVYWIGMLHDIGKIGVTDVILQKPGRLDNAEYSLIQTHVDIGGAILEDFTALPGIAEGAKYHHERWDGKGYSTHLSGKHIPEIARIICIADSFDAMTSPRVYRKAMAVDHAKHELLSCAGTQFDPQIVPVMVKLIDEGKVPININE